MKRIILASGSPRRKELLKKIVPEFEVLPSNVDESIDSSRPLRKEIEKLSFLKALGVFKENKDAIVIGSDTVVTLDNKVLGKPADKEEAREMLRALSGRNHEVITAVSIISAKRSESFSSVSQVTFMDLSDEEIEDYLKTGESMDKAGSYAIQGEAAKFISNISGDYYAIIGLPVCELYRRLRLYL